MIFHASDRGQFGFGIVCSILGILMSSIPATAQAERLEVIPQALPFEVVLTRGESRVVPLAIRNPGEGLVEIDNIQFNYGGTAKDELPENLPRPVVCYGTVSLPKDRPMTIGLDFHPIAATRQLTGELYFTRKVTGAQPELFFSFPIKVVERGGTILPKRLSGWIASFLAAVVIFLPFRVKGAGRKNNFFQSGPDGEYSISRFQVWLWTAAVLFSYAYLFFTVGPNVTIPDSIIGLMGISVGSITAATAVAIKRSKSGQPNPDQVPQEETKPGGGKEPPPAAGKPSWISSMLSESGEPSAMRLQMFAWTIATVVFFIWRVFSSSSLWDVPNSLLLLMGVSHAGYLVDKTVRTKEQSR